MSRPVQLLFFAALLHPALLQALKHVYNSDACEEWHRNNPNASFAARYWQKAWCPISRGVAMGATESYACLSAAYSENEESNIDEVAVSRIEFSLHTKNSPDFEILKIDDFNSILDSKFNKTKPTVITVHGFLNSRESPINVALKTAYGNYTDVNLIILDWSFMTKRICYSLSWRRAKAVGKHLAAFMDFLFGYDNFQWSNVVIVGHSLGAHVAGSAGKNVENGKIGTIVGLDPASPHSDMYKYRLRLDNEDAEYVECIHSNTHKYGILEPICTADFYPNFGNIQPGCDGTTYDVCSHARAWEYFAESLSGKFSGRQCKTVTSIYKQRSCYGDVAQFGGINISRNRNSSGVYFFTTYDVAPYLRP